MTEPSQKALKPCPFCGLPPWTNPEKNGPSLYTAIDRSDWQVHCDNCGVTIEGDGWSKEQATEAWNQRAATPDAESVGRLVEKLRAYQPYSINGKSFGPRVCEEAAEFLESLTNGGSNA